MAHVSEEMPKAKLSGWARLGLAIAVVIALAIVGVLYYPTITTPSATPSATTSTWDAWGSCGNGNYYLKRGWTPTGLLQPTTGSASAPCLTYQGCYNDTNSRAIANFAQNGKPMTFDECYSEASSKNAPYFGLQYWGIGTPVGSSVGQCFYANPTDTLDMAQKYGKAGNCTQNGPSLSLDGSPAAPVYVGDSWSNAIYSINGIPQ